MRWGESVEKEWILTRKVAWNQSRKILGGDDENGHKVNFNLFLKMHWESDQGKQDTEKKRGHSNLFVNL